MNVSTTHINDLETLFKEVAEGHCYKLKKSEAEKLVSISYSKVGDTERTNYIYRILPLLYQI